MCRFARRSSCNPQRLPTIPVTRGVQKSGILFPFPFGPFPSAASGTLASFGFLQVNSRWCACPSHCVVARVPSSPLPSTVRTFFRAFFSTASLEPYPQACCPWHWRCYKIALRPGTLITLLLDQDRPRHDLTLPRTIPLTPVENPDPPF